MISCIKETPERKAFLDFTAPYFISRISIFMQQDAPRMTTLENLENHRVAVVQRYAQQEILQREYPKIQLVPVESTEMGLLGVSSGKIDAVVEGLATRCVGAPGSWLTGYHLSIKRDQRVVRIRL